MNDTSRNYAIKDASQPILDAAEKWVNAARRLRAAEIDAGACGTSRDYDKMHQRQEEEEKAHDDFDTTVAMSIGDLIRQITT